MPVLIQIYPAHHPLIIYSLGDDLVDQLTFHLFFSFLLIYFQSRYQINNDLLNWRKKNYPLEFCIIIVCHRPFAPQDIIRGKICVVDLEDQVSYLILVLCK